MASVTTATSEWIQFFKDAGIPAGLAVTYAVSFVDNRIQKNMLMDLSKDIMMDLGITVIGDIIAVLKHAKLVHRQDMCKMATEAISSGQTSVKAELRRTANTPTRMIANALSHDSPPTTPVRRPDNRLSVTVSNVQASKGGKAAVSQPEDEGSGLSAAKRRRVTSEMEGKYIINMPKGTTPRTRRILAQQGKKGLKRTSVFARLGAESKADPAAGANKPTGVFSRLDQADEVGAEPRSGKLKATKQQEEDSDGEGSVLQYAGVLKKLLPPPRMEPVKKAAPTTLRRLGGKFKRPPPSAPAPSSSSNGVPPAKISVLQRLGKLQRAAVPSSATSQPAADTQDNRVTTSTRPRAKLKVNPVRCKVSSSTGAGAITGAGAVDCAGAQMDFQAVSVFKRLGSKNK
ncbi:uncharacterized protein C19orf47 homolog isoform X2 [Syngnathus typhle]|uniref:uncharacterized protein C19orf47 homolog isoform X2 n=1 Tax=Syngnathus typhle TaxID=161592 RepID=UPI002A6B5600|nr:uncharacterized protein C19orf47 homolog isoform X2 [Syngnathus typhle]